MTRDTNNTYMTLPLAGPAMVSVVVCVVVGVGDAFAP